MRWIQLFKATWVSQLTMTLPDEKVTPDIPIRLWGLERTGSLLLDRIELAY